MGIVAAETEFASGTGTHYDLYATQGRSRGGQPPGGALLYTYYAVRFVHGPADLEAAFDSRTRSLRRDGTYDVDEALGAVQDSIRPQVIGWYVLAGLAALAALAVIGQAVARQAATERADHPALVGTGRATAPVCAARPGAVAADRRRGGRRGGAPGGLASPLTPVGVARLAVPWPVGMSFDLSFSRWVRWPC